jgi:serine/threonine protein kinase
VGALADYQRIERLPTGPRSEVWLAKAPDGERVALKIVLPEVARRMGFVTTFEKETAPLFSMSHASVLRCRDRGGAGRDYFLAQEWGAGSLRGMVRTGPLAPAIAVTMAMEVCGALDYAHRRSVLHRHLVPENVFVEPGKPARVGDFGWSLLDGLPPAESKTSVRGDLFDLAGILYFALSGRPPGPRPAPLTLGGEGQSARFADFFARALSADPAARFGRASEMSLALSLLAPPKTAGPESRNASNQVSIDTRAPRANLRIAAGATPQDVETAIKKLEPKLSSGRSWLLAYDLMELTFMEDPIKDTLCRFHARNASSIARVAFASPRAMVRASALVIAQRQDAPWKVFSAIDPMILWLDKETP